jgi:Skp family chaperone for outer membrane proteins
MLSSSWQLRGVVLALALMAGAHAMPPAHAQEKLPPAIAAVVDYQRVLREAKAARGIREQIETRRKLYQEQIAKEEQKLNDGAKELDKQRAVLSAEAFKDRRDEFQKKVAGVQRMVQERRRTLDQVSAAALNQVRDSIINIMGDLSTERGFNVVMPSSAVLLFSPKIDLTEEVIGRLDKKLPSVKVPEKVAQQ